MRNEGFMSESYRYSLWTSKINSIKSLMRPFIPTQVNAKGVQAHAHVLGHLLRADKYVKYRRYVSAMRSEFVVCSQEHSQNFQVPIILHGFCNHSHEP